MRRYFSVVAVALVLSGCATLNELDLDPRVTPADEQLVFAGQLIAAEPEELDAIGERLQQHRGNAANPVDELRYALWQATPGHDGHAPEAARVRLNELLTNGRPPPEVEALIRIELRHLRVLAERAQLAQDKRRLSVANRERRAEVQALQEQIQALTTLERRMGSDGEESGDP